MDILQYTKDLNPLTLYLFLVFSSWLENIFPPIPGDTITALGAFFVATGKLDFIWVFASTTFGSVLGFFTLFLLGRYLGREFFMKKNFKYFSAEMINRAEDRYKVHGYIVVALNRFLPGVRSVISIVGGILKLNSLYVLLLALISAACWNLIWIYAGYLLGTNWETVRYGITKLIRNYNIVAGVFIAGIFLFIMYKKKRSNVR